MITEPGTGDLLSVLLRGGRSILGGLAGAYAALVGKRIVGYQEETGDLFAPAVALGMAIGRWGCFLAEPPGTATSLPWGLRLDVDQIRALRSCTWCAPNGSKWDVRYLPAPNSRSRSHASRGVSIGKGAAFATLSRS